MNVKNQIGLMMSGLVISTVMMKLTMLHVTGMEEIAATMTTQIGKNIAQSVNVLILMKVLEHVKNQNGLMIRSAMMKLTMLHVTGMEEIVVTMTTQIGKNIAQSVNALWSHESYGTKILLTIPL